MNQENQSGTVVQIIGSVVDIEFATDQPPLIYTALKIQRDTADDYGKMEVVAEIQQHLGNNTVRCIALTSTDGLRRGNKVINTNMPIVVPVGRDNLGRLFNVLGEPMDGLEPLNSTKFAPIHREPPTLQDQDTDAWDCRPRRGMAFQVHPNLKSLPRCGKYRLAPAVPTPPGDQADYRVPAFAFQSHDKWRR